MLAAALLLDALFGEPRWLWQRLAHPVVLMGRAVALADRRLNRGTHRRARGAVGLGLLVVAVALPAALLARVPLAEPLGAAVLLAHRGLVEHVGDVAAALRRGLAEGRIAVARVAGRDPESLDEAGIARAAIESAAENFSDGVVAPAFWFAVAGLPGIAVYKLVNTADSMIGHRTARHEAFGWAAARLDDLLNWLPARLTGLLIAAVGGGARAFAVMRRDAPLHKSVNAGWPEAALAASLGLSLAGPRRYGGRITADPWLNPEGAAGAGPADIERSIGLVWRAWGLVLAAALLLAIAG
ncbi:MAG TPA: adenosylcobinamide-phosphate synthase CbiB [Thermohalobaculum sp.]|nr:adenosylcobinamide-phosphate synthase CbiB [Thermohalobaculum sp.]